MLYYARVVFETRASIAEGHDDVGAARRWIEEERHARPRAFVIGEILKVTPDREIVATCDVEGWKSP